MRWGPGLSRFHTPCRKRVSLPGRCACDFYVETPTTTTTHTTHQHSPTPAFFLLFLPLPLKPSPLTGMRNYTFTHSAMSTCTHYHILGDYQKPEIRVSRFYLEEGSDFPRPFICRSGIRSVEMALVVVLTPEASRAVLARIPRKPASGPDFYQHLPQFGWF